VAFGMNGGILELRARMRRQGAHVACSVQVQICRANLIEHPVQPKADADPRGGIRVHPTKLENSPCPM